MFEQNPIIVYVEDDDQSREIMRLMLEFSMKIEGATYLPDSKDFIQKIEALHPQPDLFLLDIHVQPHTGFEMLEMLRQHPQFQDATILALTASVMNEEVQKLREAGFNGVIAKPIDVDTFPNLIKRTLNGKTTWNIKES
jgi:CheY-like chemotaxis protein